MTHHHQHVDVHARGERLIMWGYFYLGAGAILLLGFVLNATGSSSRLGLMPSQTEQVTSLLTAIIGLVSAVGGFIALLKGKAGRGSVAVVTRPIRRWSAAGGAGGPDGARAAGAVPWSTRAAWP